MLFKLTKRDIKPVLIPWIIFMSAALILLAMLVYMYFGNLSEVHEEYYVTSYMIRSSSLYTWQRIVLIAGFIICEVLLFLNYRRSVYGTQCGLALMIPVSRKLILFSKTLVNVTVAFVFLALYYFSSLAHNYTTASAQSVINPESLPLGGDPLMNAATAGATVLLIFALVFAGVCIIQLILTPGRILKQYKKSRIIIASVIAGTLLTILTFALVRNFAVISVLFIIGVAYFANFMKSGLYSLLYDFIRTSEFTRNFTIEEIRQLNVIALLFAAALFIIIGIVLYVINVRKFERRFELR